MPIFEYECRSCGRTFEHLVLPRGDLYVVACRFCGSQEVQQLISAFSVSSDGTRKLHLDKARERLRKEQRDKERAEMEVILHHDD